MSLSKSPDLSSNKNTFDILLSDLILLMTIYQSETKYHEQIYKTIIGKYPDVFKKYYPSPLIIQKIGKYIHVPKQPSMNLVVKKTRQYPAYLTATPVIRKEPKFSSTLWGFVCKKKPDPIIGRSFDFRPQDWVSPFPDDLKTWEEGKRRRMDVRIGSGMDLVEFWILKLISFTKCNFPFKYHGSPLFWSTF